MPRRGSISILFVAFCAALSSARGIHTVETNVGNERPPECLGLLLPERSERTGTRFILTGWPRCLVFRMISVGPYSPRSRGDMHASGVQTGHTCGGTRVSNSRTATAGPTPPCRAFLPSSPLRSLHSTRVTKSDFGGDANADTSRVCIRNTTWTQRKRGEDR